MYDFIDTKRSVCIIFQNMVISNQKMINSTDLKENIIWKDVSIIFCVFCLFSCANLNPPTKPHHHPTTQISRQNCLLSLSPVPTKIVYRAWLKGWMNWYTTQQYCEEKRKRGLLVNNLACVNIEFVTKVILPI